jgi:hypothetical protein
VCIGKNQFDVSLGRMPRGLLITPVASIATCATPCSLNHSCSSMSAPVIVANLSVSSVRGSLTQRARRHY